jgi:hypothetical protein
MVREVADPTSIARCCYHTRATPSRGQGFDERRLMRKRSAVVIAGAVALGLGLNYEASAQAGQPAGTSTQAYCEGVNSAKLRRADCR